MSGDENIVLKLIRQLSSPYPETRENAAMDILERLRDKKLPITPKLFSALTDALDDDYTNVIYYTALSIAYIAGIGKDVTSAIPSLGKALNNAVDSGNTDLADNLFLHALANASETGHDLSPALDAMAKALFYDYDHNLSSTIRFRASSAISTYIRHLVDKKLETENYDSALIEIKNVTKAVMDASKGKKAGRIQRREVRGVLSELTIKIDDKMNSVEKDKKKFPIKRQPIKPVRKQVRFT